ncbi:MAG: protein kinase [Anaerolineae bacterium]|nr:protein kinase [Anaerolineae bacterium]NUQ05241.1 protein kinase [Anaerolineae bacterium]
MSESLIGKKLGDYVIQEILGRGGMAHVYRGYDPNLQRFAAVKVIDSQMLSKGHEEEYRARFRREARAIARLAHPNIVGVYQFGEFDGLYYMAMEFIEGRDLGIILKDLAQKSGRLEPRQIVRIIHDIAGALDYAHAANVIHRDVKPSNIMVTPDGRAVLTDFGLALDVPEGTGGNTFGSAHYIAPEQAISSRNAVSQSDIYSLGVVLYQMVTGRVPFDDTSAMSVALKHLSDPPPPPSSFDPRLPVSVEMVILRALEKEPSKRFKNGEIMARALEEAMNTAPIDTDVDLAASGSRPSRSAALDTGTGSSSKRSTREMVSIGAQTIQFADDDVNEARRSILTAQEALRRSRRPPLLIAGVVAAAVLLLIAGVVLSRLASPPPSDPPTTSPSPAAVVENATPAFPTLQPTAEPTEAPTEPPTSTSAPSDTPTPLPSDTPPATETTAPTEVPPPTAAPTDPPTVEPTPGPVSLSGGSILNLDTALVLVYDEDALVLFNRSDQPVDVTGLVFEQRTATATLSFAATTWQTRLLSRLPAGDCLMLWRNGIRELPAPPYCQERQAWFAVGTPRRFWLSSDSSATFDVYRFGEKAATCPVNRGDCGI